MFLTITALPECEGKPSGDGDTFLSACHNRRYMPNTTSTVQKEVLPNGLVVLTEPMDYVHSVSVGIWVRSGSRREPAELNGISHFIEHMVFKGTARRTAEDIAREMAIDCRNSRSSSADLPSRFIALE